MKIIIIKENLKKGISAVEKSTGENLNLPILKDILIDASGEGIELTATNLEIGVRSRVAGKVLEPGRVAVSASVFSSLISTLPTERLNIENKGDNLLVKTDNYEGVIAGHAAEDFPLIPSVEDRDQYIEMDGDILRQALSDVIPSAQVSDVRPELSSVYFVAKNDALRFVTTDSFRLAEKVLYPGDFESTFQDEFSLLIPVKTAHEVVRGFSDAKKVRLYKDKSQILFVSDGIELISRVLDGTFPDYQSIIPKDFSSKISLKKKDFLNALKISSVVGARTSEVKIRVPENKKSIEVFSADQASGESSYVLPATIQGDIKEISFNWKHLMDGLKSLSTDDVHMGLNEDRPAILRDGKKEDFLYLIAPILSA